MNKGTIVGVGIDYLHDSFNFDDNNVLAGQDPWSHINRINITARLSHNLNDKWTFIISPGINFSGESGSTFGESLTYRGIAGLTYKINEELLVGPGIIATTRLEEDFIAFPGLIINWKINDNTILSSIITGIRPELGPVLSINHFFNRKLSGSFSISYEFSRFRLDDEGISPDGIGDVIALPVWISLGYYLSKSLKFEVYTGTAFLGEMELENDKGSRVGKDNFGPMFLLGAGVRISL